ncbi:MAG: PAS domain-containing protein [Candidatus Acidiferrales bacterium]
MGSNVDRLAEDSARAAAARLVPRLLVRALIVILLCKVLEAVALLLRGHSHSVEEILLGWVILTMVGLPILYFTSLKPVTATVATELSATANARFEGIASQVHDGVLIYDLDGRILYCNAAAERIHAAPAGSLTGQSIYALIPEKLRAAFREDLESFRKAGAGRIIGKGSTEVQGLRQDGKRITLETSTAPTASGDACNIVAVIRDVTERKRAEAESEHLVRFSDLNPNPILECALDGKVLYANPSAGQLLGAIPSAASVASLLPRFTDLARRCVESGGAVSGLESAVRNRTLLWTLQPGGAPDRILMYGTDITERKLAEEARQRTEHQVIDLLDSLPVAVRVVLDGKTVFANAASARLYGFSSSRQIIGTEAIDLAPEKEAEHMREYHRRRVAGEKAPREYESTARRRDGAEIPIEVTATRFYYDGQAASLLVARDLSTEKRLKLYEQILPVCCVCGKIRDDSSKPRGQGEWGRLDHYVTRHSDAQLSHTFCPECLDQYRRDEGLT